MDKEKMLHCGELYDSSLCDLVDEQTALLEKLYDFNATRPSQGAERARLLKEMFAEIGEDCYIEPPLYSNWACRHVHFGDRVYANFSLTLVDDTHIYVGDNTMIGPNVTLATAGHPVSPRLREEFCAQFNAPVRIGRNCWIGAGAVVLPGVTIGDGSVIGAGSVVTKDIPSGVVAAGVPCKVMREIEPEDEEYYFRGRKVPDCFKRGKD